jgi:hypothetical protein
MWLPGTIRRLLLLDWDQRVADWQEATRAPRLASIETTSVIQDMLERQLDRSTEAVGVIDTKAALMIPGVGALTTVVVGHISDGAWKSWPLVAVLAVMIALAGTAVVLSLVCLAPTWKRTNGPMALPVVLATGEQELRVRVSYVGQLGLAVQTTEWVLNAKAGLLNWAVRSGGLATILLLIEAGLGGLK